VMAPRGRPWSGHRQAWPLHEQDGAGQHTTGVVVEQRGARFANGRGEPRP
jgi:hypothetical protein